MQYSVRCVYVTESSLEDVKRGFDVSFLSAQCLTFMQTLQRTRRTFYDHDFWEYVLLNGCKLYSHLLKGKFDQFRNAVTKVLLFVAV